MFNAIFDFLVDELSEPIDPIPILKEFFKQQRKISDIEYGIELHPKHYEQLAQVFHKVRNQANQFIENCEKHELFEPDDFEIVQKMIGLYQVITK